MCNTPSQEQLIQIPRLYETEHIPAEKKLIYLHFFFGGCDWFIAEYDGDDLFFGFAILNGDYENAEWGYISFAELKSIRVHDLKIHRANNPSEFESLALRQIRFVATRSAERVVFLCLADIAGCLTSGVRHKGYESRLARYRHTSCFGMM